MRIVSKISSRVAALLLAAALSLAPAAGPAFAQVAAAALSLEVENAAKAPGDTPVQRDARTAVAKAFYDSTGMASRFAGDLAGIDLGKPVQTISVSAGTQMYQFIRDGAKYLGNFFSPAAQAQPTCLGISGTGRTQVTASLPATTALLSTAAPIVDTWTTAGVSVQTEGGCAQVVVDNTAKTKATFVK
jgi:hypothetical protein